MKNLLVAGRLLLLDLASTFFFLIVYSVTKNIALSVVLGMALGLAQIGWEFARKKPIDTMQWLSLCLVMGFGTATLISNNPRFIMVKPSLIYVVVGVVMLKLGWMNRYLPPTALEGGARHRHYFRLRLAGINVLFCRAEHDRCAELQRADVGCVHDGLRHPQQAQFIHDPVRHHALHRRASPRPDDASSVVMAARGQSRLSGA
jgi:Intracellular septation protein A